MYDSDEECADSRDEVITSGRDNQSEVGSRYALQRCLAWSQSEQEDEEDELMDLEGMKENLLLSVCSVTSDRADAEASEENFAESGLRNVYWEGRVSSDRNVGPNMGTTRMDSQPIRN
jgi:hypothetical protein